MSARMALLFCQEGGVLKIPRKNKSFFRRNFVTAIAVIDAVVVDDIVVVDFDLSTTAPAPAPNEVLGWYADNEREAPSGADEEYG
eukprot:CAMPEP_0168192366 /NCGR_PEP_ID=MMETSP0139_2-20121125/18009_1 /TAXON_ID=44445 /ORGANISM="Pseudo-nitzschia australis, Strain 10249 10 AB" /LENGTH=84 /DNA_ID=CAMNT_0008115599 /DNA_START=656 /DNA_END=911 /DNA_ORIENTATION=+